LCAERASLHDEYIGASLLVMSMAAGHRLRWIVIWVLIVGWFAALALNALGNLAHLLLLVAIGLLVYELLIPESAA